MRCKAVVVLPVLVSLLLSPMAHGSEVWWERSDEQYPFDLSKRRILIVVGDDFDFQEATVTRDLWKRWGATVDIAGTVPQLTGHLWKQVAGRWDRSETRALNMDILLADVALAGYDAVFFPGGGSPKNLLDKEPDRLKALVREANAKGVLLAAICHGPQVLAACDVVRGRRVTAHPEVAPALQLAGGVFETAVTVTDGNLVTGNWPYFESFAVAVAERLLFPKGGGPSEQSLFVTNPVLRAIKERRSVRSFIEREVEPATVQLLLRAATWAPSANNDQPWRFVVVRKRETKDAVREAVSGRLRVAFEKARVPVELQNSYWAAVFSAPVHIFAFAAAGKAEEDAGLVAVQELWEAHGVAAACQNLLLAAHAQDLGGVWLGAPLAAEEDIKRLLGAPREVRLIAVLAIGYPASRPLPPVRRPVSEVAFDEAWERR